MEALEDQMEALESQIFSSDSVDYEGAEAVFHGCVLKVPVGSYAAGSAINSIGINFDFGIMTLYSHTGEVDWKGKLTLTVGEELPDASSV